VRTLLKHGSIALVACASLAGCAGDTSPGGRPDGPTVLVQVRSDGIVCAVRTVQVNCKEIAKHLRETLKVRADEYIAVEVDTTVEPIPFDSMTAVIDSLKKSGFTTVIGSVPLPKSGG
jgi:biopolymer transport protein ExbD